MKVFAYIDPGTGSLLVQVIIGGLLAVGVVLRRYIGGFLGKVKAVVARDTKDPQ